MQTGLGLEWTSGPIGAGGLGNCCFVVFCCFSLALAVYEELSLIVCGGSGCLDECSEVEVVGVQWLCLFCAISCFKEGLCRYGVTVLSLS